MILVGKVLKARVGELEDDLREGFYRRTSNDLTDAVEPVSGNRRLLVRFQDGYEKYMTFNQLTVVVVDSTPMTK